MNFKLSELNHRQLVSKMMADLSAIERNLDILYTNGNEEVGMLTKDLSNTAEYLEIFANKTWVKSSDTIRNENSLKGLIDNIPYRATKAEDFL